MSKSMIDCRKCHAPLAMKHHGGRIRFLILPDYLPDGAVEVTCRCGERRVFRPEKKAA